MITSLFGVAWRTLQANRSLILSSVISVALSVFLVITMVLFAGNAKQSFEYEMRRLFGDFDIMAGFDSSADMIDQRLLASITSIEGIEELSPVLLDRLYVDQLEARIYTAGVDNDPLVKSRFKFTAEIGDLEVITNSSFAAVLQLDIGDEISIEGKPFRLVETLPDADANGIGVDFLIVSRQTLQQFSSSWTGHEREATYVLLKTAPDANLPEITAELRSLNENLRVDVVQESEYYVVNMQNMQYFLVIVSGLVLIAAILFNLASAETLLYKYRGQIAVMRSLGATRQQVAKLVGTQLSLITFTGTVIGFLLAVTSNQLIQRWLLNLLNVPAYVVKFAIGTAALVALGSFMLIQIFMLIPVIRSMRIAPMRIIAQNERLHVRSGRIGLWTGFVLAGAALLLMIKGIREIGSGSGELNILISALILLLGLIPIFNYYLAPLLNATAPLIKHLSGAISFVAIRNLIPQMHRSKLVILSVSMLIIISMLGSSLFTSIKHNQEQFLSHQFLTNILVKARWENDHVPDPEELTSTVKELTGIDTIAAVSRARFAYIQRDGEWQDFIYRLGDLDALITLGIIDDVPAQLRPDGMIITEELAERFQLKVGDQVELGVSFIRQGEPEGVDYLTVVGIQPDFLVTDADAYIAWGNMEDDTYALFDRLYIQSPEPSQTLAQLAELDRIYPLQLQVNSYDRAMAEANEMLMQRYAIFIAVLIVIAISVLLGICNAMMNNLESKRKEFALLRAIAVTREGIVRAVMTQVLLFVVIGCMFGLAAGTLATWVLSHIDAGHLYLDISIPLVVSGLLFIVSIAVFAPYARAAGKRQLLAELTRDVGS